MPTNKPTGASRRITTASQIKALKPEAKRYEVSDEKRRGLRLRVSPSRARTWWYTYREPGADGKQGRIHRIRLSDFPSMTLDAARTARHDWAGHRTADGKADPHEVLAEQAREKAAQIEQEEREAATEAWTVSRLAGAWIEALKRTTRPRTWQEARRHLDPHPRRQARG